MEIYTLENVSNADISDTFNLAFSDYLVPLKLSLNQFETKLLAENIRPELSAGAFDNGRLIGFVLHGLSTNKENKIAYNAGTGVIPAERGKKITSLLYDFISPILKKEGINKVELEVINDNHTALHIYKSIGFKEKRELDCYKGSINSECHDIPFRLKYLKEYDWDLLTSFWDCLPSSQNSIAPVEKLRSQNVSIGLYIDDVQVGYLIYNPITKRAQQFAVDKLHRRKGIGKALFGHIAQAFDKDIAVINVDHSAEGTGEFLTSIGLQYYIKQYEMEMTFV